MLRHFCQKPWTRAFFLQLVLLHSFSKADKALRSKNSSCFSPKITPPTYHWREATCKVVNKIFASKGSGPGLVPMNRSQRAKKSDEPMLQRIYRSELRFPAVQVFQELHKGLVPQSLYSKQRCWKTQIHAGRSIVCIYGMRFFPALTYVSGGKSFLSSCYLWDSSLY